MQGHKVTLSDYVAHKLIEALEHLQEDGCRRVHIVAHSMGARVVSGAAERLAHFFPSLPPDSGGMPARLPASTRNASFSTSSGALQTPAGNRAVFSFPHSTEQLE
jgi:pimeloyl-ACP methyl ester carboxylesterase